MKYRHVRLFFILLLIPVLLLTACSNTARNEPSASPSAPAAAVSPPSEPSVSSETTFNIKTDYSHLTPYEPMAEVYTRLSEDDMPELVPSDDYGLLLPYVGMTFMNDIYSGFDLSYKGLMTLGGMMVTDAVYSNAYQAFYYGGNLYDSSNVVCKPLYILAHYPTDVDKVRIFDNDAMHAVCAMDGSWITKLEYKKVYCFDKVMMLVRDAEAMDIDVMDYSGKILYNVKNLACIKDLEQWFYYSPDEKLYGEGYIAVRGGFFNELTGELIRTGYDDAQCFSDGLAAVMTDGLWGYIDKSFQMVIEPVFAYAAYFNDGTAYARTPSGLNTLIDKKGTALLSTQSDIDSWYKDYYIVHDEHVTIHLYTKTLQALFTSDELLWSSVYSGGHCFKGPDKTLLFFNNEKYELPKGYTVTSADAAYITCQQPDQDTTVLMTLDGKALAEVISNEVITDVVTDPAGKTLILLSNNSYEKPSYRVFNADGVMLFSGSGSAKYSEPGGLIGIQDDKYFAYIDTSGNDVFKLSLEACTAD